ncbi:hypothetical protein conserved [Leishmania donovani]|uniref:Hypothetical_protein_conserved n=1 Tax=Leishmania donovani TaxID=5661 RepID=A0A504XZJ7_LEIDO|nr:hypothetical protein CGC20_35520 [Leishmania donovani]CAJ1986807.1 hypothetical protein conserved [Leishmania donovani]VDZ42701.1 hypothetical_protein_conserved [Leishmania donovani]
MILGVGAGTFAVLVTVGVAILIALVGSYLAPQSALFIILGCTVLPFIVYGCILTSPHGPAANTTAVVPATYYRERQLPSNTDVIDKFLPVRVVVFIVVALGLFAGVAFHILTLVNSPPYKAPRVHCLRQKLEEAHPTWYR